MIASFADRGTEDVFDGRSSKIALRTCPRRLWRVAGRKLDQLNRVAGNRLEKLKGDREGQYSIRINDQYRICFIWEAGYAYKVEITDYH